jgi:dTDP-4-dehydrorhamnose 3,5-epimerase
MKFVETSLAGVLVVEPEIFVDQRGFFFEAYNRRKFAEHGLTAEFVQDNHSRSICGTIRGLHLQRRRPQTKLVRALHGTIFDVIVDVTRNSASFGRWISLELSAENRRMCFIPAGYAHGFCVVSDYAEVEYKCSGFYDPSDELTIAWNDPDLGITWPVTEPILSRKDAQAPGLSKVLELLSSK